jgi:chromosomal replication initiator protein
MTGVEYYYNDLWAKAKTQLKEDSSIGKLVYETYFEESNLVFLNEEKAVIAVPTNLQKMILTQKLALITETLSNLIHHPVVCDVRLQHEVVATPEPVDVLPEQSDDNLLVGYTFDNFIVGPSNKEAHSAALACALTPGNFYTPLFIYGNSGLGKTHLLNAIGNYIKSNDPTKRVFFTSSTDFVTSVVNSIKDNSIEAFKQRMNKLDVLLMDDIQFIAGKEKSHEVFFNIFNELVNNKKQIVLTSDRNPSEIKGLEERLISRFSSGLSVGLDSPEFETSLAILKFRLESQSVDPYLVADDVLAYIATNFSKDVRKLEGALNRLLFYSINFSGSDKIDFKVALNAFKGSSSSSDKNEISVNKIKRVVSDYYGLTKQQLVSNSRTKNIASARHIAMYFCRKFLDLPFIKIGEEFGKRDHSTVINACEKVESYMKSDINYKQAIYELEKLINQT